MRPTPNVHSRVQGRGCEVIQLVDFDLPKSYSREVFRITPALTAKYRLQAVIAADRAAVPCGRWVKRDTFRARSLAWAMQNCLSPKFMHSPRPIPDKKTRYRWEVRK